MDHCIRDTLRFFFSRVLRGCYIHTIHEEMILGDLVRTMPRINASLENRQVDYQTSMVEVEGKINKIYLYLF